MNWGSGETVNIKRDGETPRKTERLIETTHTHAHTNFPWRAYSNIETKQET